MARSHVSGPWFAWYPKCATCGRPAVHRAGDTIRSRFVSHPVEGRYRLSRNGREWVWTTDKPVCEEHAEDFKAVAGGMKAICTSCGNPAVYQNGDFIMRRKDGTVAAFKPSEVDSWWITYEDVCAKHARVFVWVPP